MFIFTELGFCQKIFLLRLLSRCWKPDVSTSISVTPHCESVVAQMHSETWCCLEGVMDIHLFIKVRGILSLDHVSGVPNMELGKLHAGHTGTTF